MSPAFALRDLELLSIYHFLYHFRQHQGKHLPGLSQAAFDLMMGHDWPDNIRELRNLLEYATIVTDGDLIRPEHLRLPQSNACHGTPGADRITLSFDFSPEKFSLDAVTRQVTAWALAKCDQNKSSAARLLKASRTLFY